MTEEQAILSIDSDQAKNMHQQQLPVILIRPETSPDDISGINASVGIVTARGGMTSHAAVVARGMGKPCICSVSGLTIDEDQQCLFIGGERLVKGDIITIDGTAGSVINDSVPVISSTPPASFDNIMDIVSKLQALEVRANAETSNDIEYALKSGARGIGLCRTEHMFFERDRILDIRKMLLSKDHKKVDRAIQSMLTYQQEDFIKIFSLTKELPVTIRLLDMPLHEFLPKNDKEIEDYCDYMQESVESVRNNISSRYEHNPMLGYRGCRVAVINPAIYEMQISAIFTAVIHLKEKHGMTIEPEIMLPLVMHQNEVMLCTQMIKNHVQMLEERYSVKLPYKLGAMIELPRAVLVVDKIAELVDFISFGTNDLTQTTMGISRDDSATFISEYISKSLLPKDPFISIDQGGVGELVKYAMDKLHSSGLRKKVKVGLCGEHGGDRDSIAFFSALGIDYVSCSPYRITKAKLVAGQLGCK